MKMKKRYEVGLDKLQLAEGEVGVMQKELNNLQPQLVTASKEVRVISVPIDKESRHRN